MFTSRQSLPRRLRTVGVAAVAIAALGLVAGCGDDTSTATDQSSSASATTGASSQHLARTAKLIKLKQPAEGATVSGSLLATGKANSNEANVPWEIRDQNDKVVAKGHATAQGWMDKLYPWTAKIDVSKLKPGPYTFVAMTDTSSSKEGPGPQKVGAHITVQ